MATRVVAGIGGAGFWGLPGITDTGYNAGEKSHAVVSKASGSNSQR